MLCSISEQRCQLKTLLHYRRQRRCCCCCCCCCCLCCRAASSVSFKPVCFQLPDFLFSSIYLSVVLRLRFQCYSASVDAAQTRDYQCGFEPSANINLALSHRQNIDMFHVQTYLPLGSDTIHGSCSPLALIHYSPTNSHSNPR